MDFYALAKDRYSCRSFDPNRPVLDSDIEKILTAAQIAPTAVNAQRQRIRVVKSQKGLSYIHRCSNCHFNAPVVLIITYEQEMKGFGMKVPAAIEHKIGLMDVGIVAAHITLQAKALGLDSCITASFDEQQMRRDFSIPATEVAALVIPIGYASANSQISHWHEETISLSTMCQEV